MIPGSGLEINLYKLQELVSQLSYNKYALTYTLLEYQANLQRMISNKEHLIKYDIVGIGVVRLDITN